VDGAPGLTWRAVESALRMGYRGLPGRDSLAALLRRARGLPERRGQGKLTPDRRRRAAALRARGLSLSAIGRRLGVSKQAVHQLLRAAAAKGGVSRG
jgi:hypothetical protein